MINKPGLSAATCSRMVSRLVSVTSIRFSGGLKLRPLSLVPIRRTARILICRSDSSPETYSTVLASYFVRANSAAISMVICSTSVDLPMPGSPPTSTIDPGTTPPPNTRANSEIGSARRSSPWLEISFSRRGCDLPPNPRAAADASGVSS